MIKSLADLAQALDEGAVIQRQFPDGQWYGYDPTRHGFLTVMTDVNEGVLRTKPEEETVCSTILYRREDHTYIFMKTIKYTASQNEEVAKKFCLDELLVWCVLMDNKTGEVTRIFDTHKQENSDEI